MSGGYFFFPFVFFMCFGFWFLICRIAALPSCPIWVFFFSGRSLSLFFLNPPDFFLVQLGAWMALYGWFGFFTSFTSTSFCFTCCAFIALTPFWVFPSASGFVFLLGFFLICSFGFGGIFFFPPKFFFGLPWCVLSSHYPSAYWLFCFSSADSRFLPLSRWGLVFEFFFSRALWWWWLSGLIGGLT